MRKPISVVVSSSAGKAEQLHELIQATLDNTVENMKLGFEFDGEFQITAIPMSSELIVHQRMVKYEEEVSSITQTEEGVKIQYKSKEKDLRYDTADMMDMLNKYRLETHGETTYSHDYMKKFIKENKIK